MIFLTNSTEARSVSLRLKVPSLGIFGILCSSEAFQIICSRLRSNLTAGGKQQMSSFNERLPSALVYVLVQEAFTQDTH